MPAELSEAPGVANMRPDWLLQGDRYQPGSVGVAAMGKGRFTNRLRTLSQLEMSR